ncbi:hypothetical protein ABZ498_18740 [Streptomyces lavendulocolor]|uniref:hypothetical protein n=1 Tax=Streptomyces lavendulocolor TaxID=67316 RepID=UPI0033D47ED6
MKAGLAGGLGLLALAATVTGLAAANASAAPGDAQAAAADDIPYAVEDFTHPGAEKILLDRKIVLKRGDGGIMLKPGDGVGGLSGCSEARDIWVESRVDKARGYCFVATGASGYLTMEIPDSFMLWTQDRAVRATVTADGKKTTYEAGKDQVTAIGEADQTGGEKRSVLVELRITG